MCPNTPLNAAGAKPATAPEWDTIREKLEQCCAFDARRNMPSAMRLRLVDQGLRVVTRTHPSRQQEAAETSKRLVYLCNIVDQALEWCRTFDTKREMPSAMTVRLIRQRLRILAAMCEIEPRDIEEIKRSLAHLFWTTFEGLESCRELETRASTVSPISVKLLCLVVSIAEQQRKVELREAGIDPKEFGAWLEWVNNPDALRNIT
jgi:hypothetical protein